MSTIDVQGTLTLNTGALLEGCPKGHPVNRYQLSPTGNIASWAKEALTLLVKTEIIGSDAGKLNPTNTTTRAKMAQVLYNLLLK